MFNTIARWIVFSSKDPAEVSLTVKGALVGLLPVFMILAGVAHLDIGQDQLTALFDTAATFVQLALVAIASVMALYGFLRKCWLTIVSHQRAQN